jgi:hypothetical protein
MRSFDILDSKWTVRVISILFYLLFYSTGRKIAGSEFWPHYHEWPIVLSPLVTVFISVSALSKYIDDKQGAARKHFTCIFAVLFLCAVISTISGWLLHLAGIFALFTFFIIWDHAMMSEASMPDEEKLDIKYGNMYINWPTFIAIVVIAVYLGSGKFFGWFSDSHYDAASSAAPKAGLEQQVHHNNLDQSIEMFVTGLIAFHLIVSAVSYLLILNSKKRPAPCAAASETG